LKPCARSEVTVKVKAPKWPPGQQADFELRQYRERLETALPTLVAGSLDYADHERRLNAVLDEQAARRRRDVTPFTGRGLTY
jgi:hypothetical protein